MTHLEGLLTEYLDWKGYVVKTNVKVGRRKRGGWKMELDIVAYHPEDKKLVHYEPSLDAESWQEREKRYIRKFSAGRQHIPSEVFGWLPENVPMEQIAIFNVHPKNRNEIAGGQIQSVDELMAQIRSDVVQQGPMNRNAIPEQFTRLRTLQLSHCGYSGRKK